MRPQLVNSSNSLLEQVNIDGLDFVASTLQMYRLFRRDFHDTYSQPVDETTVT